MITLLKEWDTSILLMINSLNNSYFDQFFYLLTQTWSSLPLYIALLWYFSRKIRIGWQPLLFLILAITLSDQIASTICKPFFERLRPSQFIELKESLHIVNGYIGGKYGFISSHAANSFALVGFSIPLFKSPYYTAAILFWAVLQSYSRVYLGVHYPADILSGALTGLLLGYLCHKLYKISISNDQNIETDNLSILALSSSALIVPLYIAIIAIWW